MAPAPAGAPGRPRRGRVPSILVLAVGLGSWLVLAAGPARADCPPLNLSCVLETVTGAVDDVGETITDTVDEVADTVTDVTPPVLDPVDEVVDTVVDQVVDTVDGAVETVDDVVDGTGDTVDDTVGGVTDPDPTGEPPRSEGAPDGAPDSGADDAGPALPDPQSRPGAAEDPGSSANGHRPDAVVDGTTVTAPRPEGAIGSPESEGPIRGTAEQEAPDVAPPDVRGLIAGGFRNAVQGFAFPLALGLGVLLFLVAQNRIDRRAPKLALAPVEADVDQFS